MYTKSSSFRVTAFLLVLCFIGSMLFPSFTPNQEAEACEEIFWAVVASFVATAGWDIIKEVKKKVTAHKDGVDPSGSHKKSDHIIVTVSGAERYKCDACGLRDGAKANVETDAHKLAYTCGGCDDTLSSPPGCGNDVYQCHTDKAKHHQEIYCPVCTVYYRGCVGGHDNCSNDCTCCASELGCVLKLFLHRLS